MRQDRLISAQIDRDREAARVQARIAERQARAQMRREEDLARAAARQQARERRAARRAARMAWLRGHVLDLLFVPVIVVPAVLAWTAMAAYGGQLYGPPGLVLPAFSEGAMWAFAIATTWTIRHHPGRPTWHLRAGTWTFAAVAAALNFLHGLTGPGTHGAGVGVVMALVSAAGVVAHQFITAGPRRSRAERGQARIDRAVARRELAARRAAVRHADRRPGRQRSRPPDLPARHRRPDPPAWPDPPAHPGHVTRYQPGARRGHPGRSRRAAGRDAQRHGGDPRDRPRGDPRRPSQGHRPPQPEAAPEAAPGRPCTPCPRSPGSGPGNLRATPGKQPGPATPERLAEFYAGELAAGQVPSIAPDQAGMAGRLRPRHRTARPPDSGDRGRVLRQASPARCQPPRRPPGRGHSD